MKFMKLGSKPDIFTAREDSTFVASELSSDITFDVDGHKFHLHKFPLLAKWGRLNKLIAAAVESRSGEVYILDFPGGVSCFEMCAKYCYGITITLSPHNVCGVRCGAEFLQMTEATEKSNLIYKLEVFLNSSILRGWKDSIICLRSSKAHLPWSEDLKIINRCIESISSKVCVDPAEVNWSFSYPRPHTSSLNHQVLPGIERSSSTSWSSRRMLAPAPKDWWLEDISDLDIDLYRRVILAIKAKGAPPELVAQSIRVYSLKCLPDMPQEFPTGNNSLITCGKSSCKFTDIATRDEHVLETIVNLLPSERGTSTCSFLLRLLRASTVLDTTQSIKTELARRVGLQLDEVSLQDLIIPSESYSSDYTVCDVDLMISFVEHYMTQFRLDLQTNQTAHLTDMYGDISSGGHHLMTAATHASQLQVAKLVDQYLAEKAGDANMSLAKFIQLAESLPDFARPVQDGLYRAIDIYLKEHPMLTKSERKKICSVMDCKKLSMDACMHAAQNDRLPLRVVVQVLFFERVRTAVSGGLILGDLPGSIQQLEYGDEIRLPGANNGHHMEPAAGMENWETVHEDFTALKGDLASIKMRIAEAEKERSIMQHDATSRHMRAKGVLSTFKPDKLFNRLFSSRGFSSSESSRTSISPEVTAEQRMAIKQQLRHSIA